MGDRPGWWAAVEAVDPREEALDPREEGAAVGGPPRAGGIGPGREAGGPCGAWAAGSGKKRRGRSPAEAGEGPDGHVGEGEGGRLKT